MGRQTGTKDKYFQHFVDEAQTKLNKWREEKKALSEMSRDAPHLNPGATIEMSASGRTMTDILKEIRASMPDSIYNPVLQIPGAQRDRYPVMPCDMRIVS